MKIKVVSKLWEKSEDFQNVSAIPRIGEKVAIWYNPAPTVIEVIHLLKEDLIIVFVE